MSKLCASGSSVVRRASFVNFFCAGSSKGKCVVLVKVRNKQQSCNTRNEKNARVLLDPKQVSNEYYLEIGYEINQ